MASKQELAELVKVLEAELARIREAVISVVGYNWADELDDAAEQHAENGELVGHVFSSLVTLQNWLDGTDRTPESYLSDPE